MKKTQRKALSEKYRRLRIKINKAGVRIFIVLLGAGFAVGLCLPLRPEHSDIEKRDLASFPGLTASGLWDGSWFSDVGTWYSDTYPLRETLISGASKIEGLYGFQGEQIVSGNAQTADEVPDAQEDAVVTPAPVATDTPEPTPELEDGTIHQEPEMAGDVYIAGDTAFELYYFSQAGADAYASMINTVHSRLGDGVKVYDLLAPTSFGVCLDEKIQEQMGASSQKDAFQYIYSRLDSAVKRVDVFDELVRHNAEYIYFRTDHHWTQLGAYYAYRVFAEQKGVKPHELSEFQQRSYPDFLGSFYAYSNQAEALAANPDTLETYIPMGTNDAQIQPAEGEAYEWFVVSDVSDYASGTKYSSYIGGDNPFTVISNPKIQDGSSCVVIKESYGNAFVPWLVDHYQNVYVVDYRYYTDNLTQFVKDHQVDDVIFVNNASALTESRASTMLALFPES